MNELKIMDIYNNINDKTWIFQIFVCGILILIYHNNEKIWNFISQFPLNQYLLFIIIWLISFAVIRLFVLLLSLIIYICRKG